ncbi:gamma-glutamyltransferase [Marivirga tractuosa]|uniref:Glutathione hydrolase proenzyme n=1 Tax=Marivirga tractuosa (strain ATCC 23168 / DSM 4126 / NBRC 15989 / NCIMB 1408 / VKM B-1430 / H-43) TaxID=643867 RepID=E4TM47_MARTH|nr:gamma-glutamyltransferase [Marivirga tractuosa]ADR21323.1 gamma-glutamyltransferase [Marivirga tractuosa DSM 4126]BDD14223.1 gamma-glutamyltransferase [Marivirga tractuosa]
MKKLQIFSILLFLNISVGFSQNHYGKNGMVASASTYASQAGLEILKDGGNAVDASIATAFTLAVTWPFAGNIGGGGFMVIHTEDGNVTTFDFREKAPLASTKDMFLDENGKLKSGSNHNTALAIGVPGTIAGLYDAHQKYGEIEWEKLLERAIQLAEYGFPLPQSLAKDFFYFAENPDQFPEMQSFITRDGKVVGFGEFWKQPALAETLKKIQDEGKKAFYEGETAQTLVDYIQSQDGIITTEDLAAYEAIERQPIHSTFKDYDLYGMPLPSSGGVAVTQMMNMWEQLDEVPEMGSVEYYHTLAEIMRKAFKDRAQYLGDNDFIEIPDLERLLSKNYARDLLKEIDFEQVGKSDSTAIQIISEGQETTHLSVMDETGMAVSMTTTLEQGYGVKMQSPELGFLLNNEMGDFNAVPGETNNSGQIGTPANTIEPGKRMLSSMSPFIVKKNNQPFLVIGSPGGRTIINTVFQTILATTVYEYPMNQAIEAPKIHHQWLPDRIVYEEYKMAPETLEALEAMGHEIHMRSFLGRLMGIKYNAETGFMEGAADSGSPDGEVASY